MKQLFKLSLLLLALLLPATVHAYNFEVDGIYYDLWYYDDNDAEIIYAAVVSGDNPYTGDIIIPDSVTYNGTTYPVKLIDGYSFYGCSELTSITIGNSVTEIGYDAFYNCSGLTNVTIPNSVTYIANYAFYNCNGITDYTWNAKNCSSNGNMPTSNIERVSIGNEVEILPSNFVNGSKITSISIPNSVISIGNSAFYLCTSLANVTIPNSVTSIGNSAFSGCTSLTNVTIPNSVTSIGSSTFYNCSGLTSVTIPNSVTNIGNYAFQGCSALDTLSFNAVSCSDFSSSASYRPFSNLNISHIYIGDSVQRIPAYFAYGNTSLTSVTIGNSVTEIGNYAFNNCNGVTDYTWNARNCSYNGNMPTSNIERVSIGNEVEILPSSFVSGSKIISISIPNSVTSIGSSAFYGCTSLTSVTIGNSVTEIGSYAFYGCTSLTGATIGNSVSTIGNYAFNNCSGLTSVTIPNSVTSIGSSAFYNCSGLTSVTIGNSVSTIGNYAFQGCSALDTLSFNAVSCSDFSSTASYRPFNNLNISYINIGDSVQRIPAYFAYGNTSLTSVTIGNSVTYIGNNAFYNCSRLTSVTIPNSVTYIGNYAFQGCSALDTLIFNAVSCSDFYSSASYRPFNNLNISHINIGDSVQRIPAYFAYGNTSLTSVTIPNSVTEIGSYAFYGCNGVTDYTWNARSCSSNGNMSASNIERVSIGNEVEILPSNFVNGSKITSISIPNSVISIGSYAFCECI